METEEIPKDEGAELEEGEITSDEDEPKEEVEAEDYELIQRPTSWMDNLKKQQKLESGSEQTHPSIQQGCSRTSGLSTSTRPLNNNNNYQPPLRPERPEPYFPLKGSKLYGDDDECISSASSSEENDSDEDGPTGKKSKRMGDPNFQFKPSLPANPIQGSYTGQAGAAWGQGNTLGLGQGNNLGGGEDAFRAQAMMFQQKRKPNNIWSKVLQDEEVSDIFGKVHVEERDGPLDLHIDRGPESFSIKLKNLPRPPPTTPYRSDSSSISSGGLTDNELEFLRGGPECDQYPSAMDVPVRDDTGEELCGQFGRPRPRKRRLDTKKRRQKRKRKNRMVNRMKKMTPDVLGKYMAEKLAEPKTHLLVNAITLIGREPCIALFLKTMKIERRGGLLIKNQERRRTPGGVFFYLLRGDKKFPLKLINKIFADEREIQKRSVKRDYQKKRLAKKAKLEKKKNLHEQEQQDEADKKEGGDEVTFQPIQDGMEEESDGSVPEEGQNDSDLDSDEFFGIQATPTQTATIGPPREVVSYETTDDFIDIHCDPTDII